MQKQKPRSNTEHVKKSAGLEVNLEPIKSHFAKERESLHRTKDGIYTGAMNQFDQKHGLGKWHSTDNDQEFSFGFWA